MNHHIRLLAVAATAAGLTVLSAGSAYAIEVPPISTDATVRLDHSPSANSVIQGIQQISGRATAPEGVLVVRLYVLQHAKQSVADTDAIASQWYDVPSQDAAFSFEWNPAATPNGVYDIVLVSDTTTRMARAEIMGVKIQRPVLSTARPTKSGSKPQSAGSTPVSSTPTSAQSVTPLSHSTGKVAAVTSTAKKAKPKPVVVPRSIKEPQNQAFYAAYGQLPYVAPAMAREAAKLAGATRSGANGLWPSLAASMVLLLTAAHIQRVLRQQHVFR